jgi:hypothetical protein
MPKSLGHKALYASGDGSVGDWLLVLKRGVADAGDDGVLAYESHLGVRGMRGYNRVR